MMDDKLRKRFGYEAIEQYDTERLAKLQEHYKAILELLGGPEPTAWPLSWGSP